MANEFFGFSPEAFEQFARALALAIFGPGVTAFGNGPDGGREATFRGEVPYPYPPATQWSGYGVIQAKCKEKSESTDKDQRWALKLLNDELKTFVTSEKRDPKPDYYVFVTNIELSSTAGGGRDTADKLTQSYYGKLPLKGHAIWDANQLTAFLTRYEELRRCFVAYLTPGDVLAAMLVDIERRQPNATRILTAFLERELRADESARLDQAGNRTEEQLRLARLFFDLPAAPEQRLLPPDEKPDETGKLPSGVLWELLRDGTRKLDPKSVYEQELATLDSIGERFPTGHVLLGGPGSGKSTVGQFLAQIHRAALLSRRAPYLLEPQTRQIITETRALCDQEGLPWPATPRYPFRVELNRFAKALVAKDSDRIESLGRYLLNRLKREHTLTYEGLLEWLATYPWLLILDGLDEVPATSNRDILVKAVNDFLAEARQVEADLFVVATSRQRGYGGEFASGPVAFRHILPLSTTRALRYVKRYAAARFGDSDPNRAQDIVDKLRQSARRDLTAQLMSSPLQVTFMATVVAARGDPGEDRWQLFDSYYRTIYDRERQKAVPPYDAVLSKQQPTIERLHHDIGFWLQYQGETAGGTPVSLPIAQFERLVDVYLSEVGREGIEKEQMVRYITDAARHRLVFLTSRVEGELSFDVRSLQEYMAAECLMTGDPEDVKARLRAIAPAPYWRNVFLFAASKCFVDARSRHLQDAIRLLCDDLNNSNDSLLATTRVGAELALDVLQSGAVAENPSHARHLARIALALLAQPYLTNEPKEGASADQRLALAYRDALAGIYREQLALRIGQANVDRTLGAWPLLVRLVDRGVDWATHLAEQSFPPDDQVRLKIVRLLLFRLWREDSSRWLGRKLGKLLPAIPPPAIWRDLVGLVSRGNPPVTPDFLAALCTLIRRQFFPPFSWIPGWSSLWHKRGFRAPIVPLVLRVRDDSEDHAAVAQMPRRHPGWLPLILTHNFLSAPNRQTLAQVLKECANGGWEPSHRAYLAILPWPLAACLAIVQSSQELHALAARVAEGALGDTAQWEAAEEHWQAQAIKPVDFLRAMGFDLFGSSVADWFWSPLAYNTVTSLHYSEARLQALSSVVEHMPPGSARDKIERFLQGMSSRTPGISRWIDASGVRSWFEEDYAHGWWHENVFEYPQPPEPVGPWLEFFDLLGRSELLSPNYRLSENDGVWVDTWQKEFLSNPSRLGLLRLLGRLASARLASPIIPTGMLDLNALPEPRFRLAALLVRLAQPGLTEADANDLALAAVALLSLNPPAEPGADDLIMRTIERHLDRVPALERFLLRLHQRMPTGVELGLARCERLLREVLHRRASDLQAPGQLQKLQLPVVPAAESAG